MHIHHKNMKYLCRSTEDWIEQNLSYLGIKGFACNFIDLKENMFLPLGTGYEPYCEFIEKKLHHDLGSRIVPGIRHWNTSEVLFQIEEKHFQSMSTQNIPATAQQPQHAFDWTIKTSRGFEMFCAVSHQPLQPHQIQSLKHWMHVFSYQGAQVKKYKPKAILELQNRAALEAKFLTFDTLKQQVLVEFQKAKFGQLILTSKEQTYIQHLVLQRSYQDIAARYHVSEMAVLKVIHNIKRKLGGAHMTIHEMLDKLNACGALQACMQLIKYG
jgi:DNA-binding CsgD family transcriptional regulator